ncbi:MAG TPA: hypothetical protein VFP69_01430 [Streptomyces sp.]|nr:hypothetical protein [Streptomyces sp.]
MTKTDRRDTRPLERRPGREAPSARRLSLKADGFHCVFMPDGLIESAQSAARPDRAPREPRPPFPAQGGLVPWMTNEHEQSFHWITEGPDPDRWPVCLIGAEPEAGDRFDRTATQYLFRHLTDPRHPIPMPVDFRTHWFMDCSGKHGVGRGDGIAPAAPCTWGVAGLGQRHDPGRPGAVSFGCWVRPAGRPRAVDGTNVHNRRR